MTEDREQKSEAPPVVGRGEFAILAAAVAVFVLIVSLGALKLGEVLRMVLV